MRAILRSGWSMQNLTNTGKIFVFLVVLGVFNTYPPRYSSSMLLSFGLLHLDLVSCCFIDIQNYIYSIMFLFTLNMCHESLFFPFFKLKRYSWKKMLWQTSACICSVAKSIIFFWMKAADLFIYFHLGDKTAALRFYFEKKIAWPILVCFILKGRVTMRRYANQFIPQFSVLFKTLKSPPVPVFWLVRVQWKAGVCHPINTENWYTPADFWQMGQVWSLPGRLSFSSLVKIVEQ